MDFNTIMSSLITAILTFLFTSLTAWEKDAVIHGHGMWENNGVFHWKNEVKHNRTIRKILDP